MAIYSLLYHVGVALAYLRMVCEVVSDVEFHIPMPGVKTVNGMIGISDALIGRHMFGQPYQMLCQQRFERIGADHR